MAPLAPELITAGCSGATRFSPAGDKIMHLHPETATIENGFVWLPDEAPGLADYLPEFAAFSRGRYDDQVDSTAQALAWTKQRPAEPGS
jgi:predicted phage terminase large subunit-like protein